MQIFDFFSFFPPKSETVPDFLGIQTQFLERLRWEGKGGEKVFTQ